MGGTDRSRAGDELHGVQVRPRLIGQTNGCELAVDLQAGDEVADWQRSGVGSGEDVVELVKVWLGEAILAGDDELVGSELDCVVLLVGGMGEDDDLGSEGPGELDGEVWVSAWA